MEYAKDADHPDPRGSQQASRASAEHGPWCRLQSDCCVSSVPHAPSAARASGCKAPRPPPPPPPNPPPPPAAAAGAAICCCCCCCAMGGSGVVAGGGGGGGGGEGTGGGGGGGGCDSGGGGGEGGVAVALGGAAAALLRASAAAIAAAPPAGGASWRASAKPTRGAAARERAKTETYLRRKTSPRIQIGPRGGAMSSARKPSTHEVCAQDGPTGTHAFTRTPQHLAIETRLAVCTAERTREVCLDAVYPPPRRCAVPRSAWGRPCAARTCSASVKNRT